MRRRTRDTFTTVRSEGAMLPTDILQRIAAFKADGLTSESYHLPSSIKLNEAIAQSWSKLLPYWRGFKGIREKLPPDDTGGIVTRDHWLLPLFQELGYGRLTTQKAIEIDSKTYPITRFWRHTPFHLLGFKIDIDRRTPGVRGAATSIPHSMVQEFLNRTEDHLWAFLSNGHRLRILRDTASLSRQSYVEFDLEAMFDGEVYSDFALFWLLCHESRVEVADGEPPEKCWLETWSKLAHDQGTRVLDKLRGGVEHAIEALGRGFLAHKKNQHLRDKLKNGQLDKQDYYRQLLRIVYRLLFLFVAEDRELLHPLDANAGSCAVYDEFYSTRRLREMSRKASGSRHADLWHSLSLVFDSLEREGGCPELGLPGMGGFLWSRDAVPDLIGPPPKSIGDHLPASETVSLISNQHLLNVIRALAWVEQDKLVRGVDYRNLGAEELGSIYESLLELNPDVSADAATFKLNTAAGNERKTTGSYYTPDSLVQCLLDSALEPVVDDRIKGKTADEAAQAILDMKVCDPAVGSGHFLIAAAHRMARRLAGVRSGESEPGPGDYQHALRDVIGRCLYGVDLNPMAVELCKVSLWMEALEPGKPLSFLDHHIQCGNSLLGTSPKLLADGIPDDAFKPIEGDVKSVASDLKKRNKQERKDIKQGQDHLFEPTIQLGNLPNEFTRLTTGSDESVADVKAKARLYTELVSGADYRNARLLADTWCAVFVWKKDNGELGDQCPTAREFRKIESNPHSILPHVKDEVRRLADQYQFFHWHLAFPDVFQLPDGVREAENEQTRWIGGFDVVLGNPPWEHTELKDKEWFATRRPEFVSAKNAAQRKKLIAKLVEDDPDLFTEFSNVKRLHTAVSDFIRNCGRYPLCGVGRVNTYAVFAETNQSITSNDGRAGFIIQSDIATGDTYKEFFSSILQRGELVSFYDFVNTEGLFPNVHRTHPHFCLITLSGSNCGHATDFAFWNTNTTHLAEDDRHFSLSFEQLSLLNPNTKTCPIFRSRRDAEITLATARRVPVLVDEAKSKNSNWEADIGRMFNASDDASHFDTGIDSSNGVFKLYESKSFWQFDHRYATFNGNEYGTVPDKQKCDETLSITTLYQIRSENVPAKFSDRLRTWYFVYRIITNSTNERTLVGSILPRCGVLNSANLVTLPTALESVYLLANFNSFVADYFCRLAMGGANLHRYVLQQIPMISKASYDNTPYLAHFVVTTTLELVYTAWDVEAFALDCGYAGPPFRWDEERRFLLRCELDAAYFHLYLGPPAEWGTDSPQLREMFPTPRDAVDYIMETFPIVKRKDIKRTEVKNEAAEVTAEGTFITKDTILEIYDAMQVAIDSGEPYQTRLDPPPGPPVDAGDNFIPISEWDEANWPSHVHLPREVVQH